MKKYKGFWVCEIHADNFSTSSYFGDGEGFPTVGYDIEAESVEDAEKKMKEIWESENKVENWIRDDVEGLTPKLLELSHFDNLKQGTNATFQPPLFAQ